MAAPMRVSAWRCTGPPSQPSKIVPSARTLHPGRKLPRLRPFSTGFVPATMNKPLPAPPGAFDLVQSFDALALAGKKPNVGKRLPDPPAPVGQREPRFVGGFNPAPSAGVVNQPRPPPPPPTVDQRATARTPPPEARAPSKQLAMPIPVPYAGKQSLTMQYALGSLRQNAAALAPPFVTVPPRPHSDSKVASKPPSSAVTGPSQPALDVTVSRPRAVSVPLSPAAAASGKHTAQCSGMTRAGKQCSRQVKLPATHSLVDPTPALYCHQHKEVMMSAQTGFYVRKAGNADRFVEFSRYIPEYLQTDTQLALKVEMEKATSPADVPGYIYTFEIRDPKRPDVIQLKVGRAVNLAKRLDQWDKQCGSKVQIPRGWWPGTVEGNGGTAASLLKGNIKAGDPGPYCHRVERLVHLELADLSLHAPYLDLGWPNSTPDTSQGAGVTNSSRKTTTRETTCLDCGVVHKEIFTFPRPERGRYKGKEWDLIVKPVIEKWGRFVKDYYT